MPVKATLKDKLEDDVLDLSLMQLTVVPVKEISTLTKGTTLDLSNNSLSWLPENFPTLTHLIKLDLSKNELTELPEYFGQLKNLRHLDLYSNQLSKLPISFAQLKNLKWLDLKNNPLVPALQQAAGPCITKTDCAMCAKKVVALLQSMQSQLERERQRRVIKEQKLERERLETEEAERERIRAEKRAAKERRREEARAKELEACKREEKFIQQRERVFDTKNEHNYDGRANYKNGKMKGRASGSWLWSFLILLIGFMLVMLGTSISLLWMYTGGHLDQKSIEKALPVLQKDVDATATMMWKKLEYVYGETEKWAIHYMNGFRIKSHELWKEFVRRNDVLARYVNTNYGPMFCSFKREVIRYWNMTQRQCFELWKEYLKPFFIETWTNVRPYFQKLGEIILELSCVVWDYLKVNVPIYYDFALIKANEITNYISKAFSGVTAS